MHIETPTMGEILVEEFMEPNRISAYRLAKDIDVPVSRIQDIIKGRRKVTADTSIRLGKYFGVSDKYFLNLQNDIDIRNLLLEKDNYSNVKILAETVTG
jgi:addiction module HigA family antidote